MDTNAPIVVGVDGSRFGRAALSWALAEGRRRDCPVHALLVAHTAPVAAAGRPTTIGLATTLAAAPGVEHRRLLDEAVREVVGDTGDPRLTAEVVAGGVAETLCALSKDARLLVVGSHGHGNLTRTVLGGVARYCVHHASCPVVVIPAEIAAPRRPMDAHRPMSYGPGPLL